MECVGLDQYARTAQADLVDTLRIVHNVGFSRGTARMSQQDPCYINNEHESQTLYSLTRQLDTFDLLDCMVFYAAFNMFFSHITAILVHLFGWTRIEPATSRTRGGNSTTMTQADTTSQCYLYKYGPRLAI